MMTKYFLFFLLTPCEYLRRTVYTEFCKHKINRTNNLIILVLDRLETRALLLVSRFMVGCSKLDRSNVKNKSFQNCKWILISIIPDHKIHILCIFTFRFTRFIC
jgi:hypothetical protein